MSHTSRLHRKRPIRDGSRLRRLAFELLEDRQVLSAIYGPEPPKVWASDMPGNVGHLMRTRRQAPNRHSFPADWMNQGWKMQYDGQPHKCLIDWELQQQIRMLSISVCPMESRLAGTLS